VSGRSRAAPDKLGTKIVLQYRAKGGFVYEITSGATGLSVHISPTAPSADATTWRVEAEEKGQALSPVEATGATAADAFRELTVAWKCHSPSLFAFDWEAVARELRLVRAVTPGEFGLRSRSRTLARKAGR
jgi:hypothetical protein